MADSAVRWIAPGFEPVPQEDLPRMPSVEELKAIEQAAYAEG